MNDGVTVADRRVHFGTIPLNFLKNSASTLIGLPAGLAYIGKADWLTVLGIAVVGGAVALLWTWFTWRHHRYGVGADEIVIEKGFIGHSRRSIPFERVQDVDIEQGPLHRLFKLATVRIETGGGAKDEGVLDSVTLAEADRLRAAVRQWRAGERTTVEAEGETALPVEQGRLLFAMALPRVLAAGVYNFSLVYFAGLYAVLQSLDGYLPFDVNDPRVWFGLVEHNYSNTLAIEAGLALIPLAVLVGLLFGIARTLLRDYGFKLWVEGERFRRQRGLLTRTEVVLPKRRVQLARIKTGPIRRRFGWFELFFQTLSAGTDGGGHQAAAPLAQQAELAEILAEQSPLRLPEPEELAMVSTRHFVRMALRHLSVPAFLFTAATIAWAPGALLFLSLPLFLVVPLFARRFHRYGLSGNLLFVRRGVIRQQLWIVPVAKIQSLTIRQSWLQRMLGVASLTIDTAGAPKAGGPHIADLRERRARALLAELSGRLGPAHLIPAGSPAPTDSARPYRS